MFCEKEKHQLKPKTNKDSYMYDWERLIMTDKLEQLVSFIDKVHCLWNSSLN